MSFETASRWVLIAVVVGLTLAILHCAFENPAAPNPEINCPPDTCRPMPQCVDLRPPRPR